MKKTFLGLMVALIVLSTATIVSAADITGKWSCNDGGIYYVRQVGDNVYWYGEKDPIRPQWANVASGTTDGSIIYLSWADLPKGASMNSGTLTLRIDGYNKFVKVQETGTDTFGGQTWNRAY